MSSIEINRAEKIRLLAEQVGKSVPVYWRKKIFGLIPLQFRTGYLWINEGKDSWNVMLGNGESSHSYAFDGPVYGADFRKDNGERRVGPMDLTGAWKSALSMWPIRDTDKAVEVFNCIGTKVDRAYEFHLGSTA